MARRDTDGDLHCLGASWRIITSRFQPTPIFERVVGPEDLEPIVELNVLTNPQLRDKVDHIQLVPPDDPVSR